MAKKQHFGQKTRQTQHIVKIMAFDENQGFRDLRDFLLSLGKMYTSDSTYCTLQCNDNYYSRYKYIYVNSVQQTIGFSGKLLLMDCKSTEL